MKKVLLYIAVGISLLAIPLTVYLVGQNQDTRKRAAPASTLSFTPAATSVKVGDTFTLSVKLDTATNQVGLIQLRIVYDPAFLSAVDITNDTFAPSIRVSKKIDPNGKISISVGAKDTTSPISGTGSIAIATFKAIKSSATPILVKFTPSPDTVANALNETAEDVLVGRSPASITILNADGTPGTATPGITPSTNTSITPTPTGRPITPTATSKTPTKLTPSLTPTPSASGSASATDSAVLITSFSENEEVATATPQIRGKGIPGTTITIIIHSETEITATVTVDENGNWVYTPDTPLEPGDHTVQVMTTDPDTGATQTDTTAFVVASGADSTGESTGSAIPVSGTAEITLALSIIGLLCIISGFSMRYLLQ